MKNWRGADGSCDRHLSVTLSTSPISTTKRAIADRGSTASGKDFDALDRRHRQGFQRVAKMDIRNNPAIDKKHGRESAERANAVDSANVATARTK